MNNGENVGKISYSVEIDLGSLRSGAKTAEQAVKTSFSSAEAAVDKSTGNMNRNIEQSARTAAALAASFLALRSVGNFLGSAIDSANRYQSAMIGLSTVSKAFDQDTTQVLGAAQELSSDGLIPLTQSAAALRNLLAAGFGVEDAKRLLMGLKDQSAFNRQSFYDLGGAVVATTEGIRNGNSVLADATGTTKNLSVMAKEAGVGIDQMGSIQSNTAYRTAVLNGFLQDTNRSMGDAARYSMTAAGADQRLSYETEQLKIKAGQLANAFRMDAVAGLTSFIASNQDAIITLGAGLSAMIAFAAGAYAVSKAVMGLRVAFTALAAHPIIAILTLTVGILASLVSSKLLSNVSKGFSSMGDSAGGAQKNLAGVNDETTKLAKNLAKINRDYDESLAEIVKRHEDSIKTLTKQVNDENVNYNAAIQKRLADFQVEQGKEEDAHQVKVDKLQNQIDFLRRYNNASNAQQLTDLQFALAKENTEYAKRNAERVAAYDADTNAAKLSYDQRMTELSGQLAEESALLTKHAADVAGIRNLIMLDEIDKLKRSRDEQISSAREAAAGSIKAIADNKGNFEELGNSLGTALGNSMKDAIKQALIDTGKGIANFLGAATTFLVKGFDPKKSKDSLSDIWKEAQNDPAFGFRASGGSVSAGSPYLVGENQDGSINRTTEMFVPKRNGTIVPADELQKAVGSQGGGGGITNVNISLSGIMTSSRADERAIAERLIARFNEVLKSKGQPQLGV